MLKKKNFYFCLFNLSPSSLLEILTAINDVYVFTESDVPFRVIAYLGRAHTRAPAKTKAEVSWIANETRWRDCTATHQVEDEWVVQRLVYHVTSRSRSSAKLSRWTYCYCCICWRHLYQFEISIAYCCCCYCFSCHRIWFFFFFWNGEK